MKHLIPFLTLILGLFIAPASTAQQGAVPAGGDVQTASGSLAYSVGQVAYVPLAGEAGSANPGLQQPNLSATVATDEPQQINGISVYPNPTQDQLFLEVADPTITAINELSYQLFDMNGQLILQEQLTQDKSSILMNPYTDGMYMLRIYNAEKKSISFKIFKTH